MGTATLKTVACQYNSMASSKIAVTTTRTSAAITLGGAGVATLNDRGYGPHAADQLLPDQRAADRQHRRGRLQPDHRRSTSTTLLQRAQHPEPRLHPAHSTLLAASSCPILQAAGVTVGGAEVAYLSTNCDAVSLVQ